ncbi:uncharacterized protein LOC118556750 [Fundulus heteroclitus]|uniref:uncharacterized protein LOC118556750 n=1 Tax=Fundulus heteroclitus TaxID=8078 RepID=UPI00165C3FE8|nr:uncharacterized protein LOC118556750 [Fundulus heteroclitus]
MPRLKSFRRAQAFRKRKNDLKRVEVDIKVEENTFVACQGTGNRQRDRPWPTSSANNTCKLVIPPEPMDKKFVFVVGDSHLRAVVDGFAPIKADGLYFGFLAVPGGTALDLRTELLNAVIPRTPDVVCLLAPSNTLRRSTVVSEAGKRFEKLLTTVCTLFPKVFVLDFPPRLDVDPQVQSLLRQEFRRVSVQLGVQYKSVAELFPMSKLHLWSRDGVHLSDDDGMKILTKAIYETSDEQIPKPTAETKVTPTMSHSPPKLLCTPDVPVVAPQNPFESEVVGSHKKASPTSSQHKNCASPKRVLHLKVEEEMKFSVELNPKWLDDDMLGISWDGNTSTLEDASIASFQEPMASPSSSQHQSCASPKKEEEMEFSVELNPKWLDDDMLEILGDGNTSTFGDASTASFKKTKSCDRVVAGEETVTKNALASDVKEDSSEEQSLEGEQQESEPLQKRRNPGPVRKESSSL